MEKWLNKAVYELLGSFLGWACIDMILVSRPKNLKTEQRDHISQTDQWIIYMWDSMNRITKTHSTQEKDKNMHSEANHVNCC